MGLLSKLAKYETVKYHNELKSLIKGSNLQVHKDSKLTAKTVVASLLFF